jgi:O-antigen ligase
MKKYKIILSHSPRQRESSSETGVSRKIIEWGIIGLIIFSPLPAASVYEWSILVIQLTVVVMMIAYFMMKEKPEASEALSYAVRWPRYMFIGVFALIFIQLIPLPKYLVQFLAPNTFSFKADFSPGFSQMKFITLSLIPSRTLQEGLELLTYFFLAFLIFKVITKRQQIMRIFYVLVIMGIFEALYGLFELYRKESRILFYKKTYGLDSVTGTFVNRNHFSGYLEMIIPLAIGLIIARSDLFSVTGKRWREKILHLSRKGFAINMIVGVCIIIMSLAIILSKSRSGVFVLVFTFILFFELTILYFGRAKEQQRWTRNFLIVTFLLITFISLYIGIEATIERFSLDELLREGRPLYWNNVSTMIREFPLFGIGLGSFASVYPSFEAGVALDYGRLSHAHNDYLEYLAELGLISGILLIGGLLFMAVNSFLVWRERRHPEVKGLAMGGIIAVVSILIHSLTDFNLHIPANMLLFTVVLSLTMVTAFYQKSEK